MYDKDQFDADFKNCFTKFMIKYWGERCSEHEDGCPTCNAWDNFDIMIERLENPDSVYTYRTKTLEMYDLKELEKMSALGWNAFAATYMSDVMSNLNTMFYFRKKL
ncbi:MAG: hypothetical protein KAS66_03370 [Candidatus Omnitrophica bacterium]|nr:hypothetical protein [Candidatus Omnitrophota bacterium]